TVVSRELDDRPTLVHNLEVAGAHTYFAGELEAWGHNASSGAYLFKLANGKWYAGKGPKSRCKKSKRAKSKAEGSPVVLSFFWPATSTREAFVMEDQLICDLGGIGGPDLINVKNSPGRKLRQ
ncbi:hypothetical protein, partial [Frigidibacter sp. SD6-1]|uniref:hypothetical protein n=1 Tax=Frigidibacter sp. SD6-1 TaxID=3032581 RepID=UPI0024DF6E72